MKLFILSRTLHDYTISYNDRVIITKRWNSDTEARDWALNFITSWPASALLVNFDMEHNNDN